MYVRVKEYIKKKKINELLDNVKKEVIIIDFAGINEDEISYSLMKEIIRNYDFNPRVKLIANPPEFIVKYYYYYRFAESLAPQY